MISLAKANHDNLDALRLFATLQMQLRTAEARLAQMQVAPPARGQHAILPFCG